MASPVVNHRARVIGAEVGNLVVMAARAMNSRMPVRKPEIASTGRVIPPSDGSCRRGLVALVDFDQLERRWRSSSFSL